jgi:ClpX C4-type zinc finger
VRADRVSHRSGGQRAVPAGSFCLKPMDPGSPVVAGPGVCICDGCVVLCADVIGGRPSAIPTLAPWELAPHKDEGLVALPPCCRCRSPGREELDLVGVHQAGSLEATWAAVGRPSGMHRA